MSTSVRALLAEAAALLTPASGADARADAEILIAHALGWARTRLWSHPEVAVPAAVVDRCRDLLRRRAAGEPVAYLTGRRDFWTLELEVTPAVLIPRPETERLVEEVLALFPAAPPIRLADLGTGSGALALALAAERPAWQIVATDASPEALAVARRNAERLRLGNVELRCGSWAEALGAHERFAAIVSNPPYVAEGDPHLAAGDLPFEPRSALVAGADGLAAIRVLIPAAVAHLRAGGWLLLEHGAGQGAAVRALLEEGGLAAVRTLRDLAGHERASLGRRDGLA